MCWLNYLPSPSPLSHPLSLSLSAFIDWNSLPSNELIQVSVVNLESQILTCKVPESVPRPQVSWNGLTSQHTNNGRVAYSQNGTLIFSYWDRDIDNGYFQCYVTNPVLGTTVSSSHYWTQPIQGACSMSSQYSRLGVQVEIFVLSFQPPS